MGSINIGEVGKGTKLIFDNYPWQVLEVNFVKPGKGNAFYKLRVINLITRNTLEKTLRGGEKVDTADVADVDMQFLYKDANGFVFMDQSSYEQMTIPAKVVGDAADFMLDQAQIKTTLWNGEPIAVVLPHSVTMEIEYTEPAIKGDTQSRVMKEAKLAVTGALVQVPIFLAIGEKIKINTETREYLGRAEK